MLRRLAGVALVTALGTTGGCRGPAGPPARKSPLETGIARDLTARFGMPVTVTCFVTLAIPTGCSAKLADGTALPIVVDGDGDDDSWTWRIDGVIVESAPVVAYVKDALVRLGVAEDVSCGPPLQVVPAGDRIACSLSGGGAAFVQVAADGSTSLELALDPGGAASRSEALTPDREAALVDRSRALELLRGESDGEEEVSLDRGESEP